MLGHVGDGNFHVTFLYDPEDEKEKELTFHLSDRIVKYVYNPLSQLYPLMIFELLLSSLANVYQQSLLFIF